MYFGPPVEGPFTVGASLLLLILHLKKKRMKKKNQSGGHFPNTTETRCSSSLTEATKHLAKGGRRNGSHPGNVSCGHGRVRSPPHSLTV